MSLLIHRTVSRRIVLKMCTSLPVIIAASYFKCPNATYAHPNSDRVRGYGLGFYGLDDYPGYFEQKAFLPIITGLHE